MLTIYYCDDNNVLRKKYGDMICSTAREFVDQVEFKDFASGDEMLEYIDDEPNAADIVYLDVIMPGSNGIETAQALRDKGWISEIIFLTSSEEFLFDSFDVAHTHYYIKSNISEETFKEILSDAIQNVKSHETDVFNFKSEKGQKTVSLMDVLYIKNTDKGSQIYCKNNDFWCEKGMEVLDEELTGKFFSRINDDCIINLRVMTDIRKGMVSLMDCKTLDVDSKYEKEIKEKFSEFLIQQM